MKIIETPQQIQSANQSFSELRRISLALVFAITMTFLALSGKAANILVNPGFEASPIFTSGSWSQHSTVTWSSAPASAADPSTIKLIRTGTDGMWFQGVYSGAPQDQNVSQTIACFPGNAYTADAWYSAYVSFAGGIGGSGGGGSGLFTADGAGNEDGWVEVLFFNSGNVLLADYKSAIIDPVYDANAAATLTLVTNALGNVYLPWQDFPVTNQYDPSTLGLNADPDSNVAGLTNTLANGQMIAPAGAVTVQFGIHLFQAQFESGAPFWDDATLNQVFGPAPSVVTSTPDGTKFFNGASTNFTFTIVSQSAGGSPLPTNSTSSVGILVNGVNQAGSLQFSGSSTALTATLPNLASNSLFTITMSVTNSVGLVSSTTVTFDTFPTNVFIVSAEDYDFTNGQFIQNPTPTPGTNTAPNSYSGTAGTLGVDMSTYGGGGVLPGNGAAQLIRVDGNTAEQKADDIQLPLYAAQNNPNVYNVQVAYNNGGNWFNYTRNYSAGNYLIYLRYNNPTAGNIESLNILTSGYGMTTQTTNNLGVFIGAATGAGYAWVPLTDTNGNKLAVNLPAGTNTLQLLSGNSAGAGGIANFVDFILVPTVGSPPVISNLSPNNVNPPINTNIFLNVTNITFSVSSASSTVASSNIHILVNGVDITSAATFTGNTTSWNVSVPCPQNQLINLVINATDANGANNSVSETFDTFSQNNFMIEAVDFNFNDGQFIDNPAPTAGLFTATNSYYLGGIFQTNTAVQNVDYVGSSDGGGEAWNYRPLDTGVGQEISPPPGPDFLRNKFINADGMGDNAQDYDIGFWNGGFWENYTRTFPTNTYNVFSRMAGGSGPFNNTTLSLVTGATTPVQTTKLLGSFADPNAAGWSVWHWIPMRDTNGNLAKISLGGVQTVRATSGGGLNAHYFMFVPTVNSPVLTATKSGSSIQLQFLTQMEHNYTVLYNSTLNGGTWQTLPSGNGIPGDGTVKTVTDALGVGATQRFYKLQID